MKVCVPFLILMTPEISIHEIAVMLKMQPHPEGGYFKETYRSELVISHEALTPHFPAARNICTAIYFLIGAGEFSAFHRIRSDEIWHFYAGDPLHVHEIKQDGTYRIIQLGHHFEKGEEPQAVVAAHSWFASECAIANGWSLVGCTVAPGFDFEDFELANKEELIRSYPQHATLIARLCKS